MEHLIDMSFDEWFDTYQPVDNHLSTSASFDGKMFETFGDEWEYVRSLDPSYVWTYIDNGDSGYIIDGIHLVNRMGYFVSEYPRTNDKQLIQVLVYSDADREDCLNCGVIFDDVIKNIDGEGFCPTCGVELGYREEEEVNA